MQQTKTQQSPISKIFGRIKHADMYSQFVHLSFQGKKKIYTLGGLLATFTVTLIICGFGTYKGIILIQRTQFETQMASILRPIDYQSPEIIQFNEFGFDFAVKAVRPMTPEIGELVLMHQVTKITFDEQSGKNVSQSIYENVDIEACTYDTFNHSDRNEFDTKQMGSYYCMKNKSQMALGGSYSASHYESLIIQLNGCKNGSEVVCASQQEIDSFMQYQYIVFRFIDYYFDKDQKVNPIRSYINDQYYFGMLLDQSQQIDFRVKLSRAVFDENLTPWSHKNEQEFPQIDNIFTTYATKAPGSPYLQIGIKLDFFSNIYQKNLYSFMDYISQLGGLFNALYGFGRLVIFLFIDTFIAQTLINMVFTYTDKTINSSQQLLGKQFNAELGSNQQNFKQKIIAEAIQRKQVDLSSNRLNSIFCRTCRSSDVGMQKNYQLIQQGKKKLRYDLDIVALFKMMQEFKLIKKLLFSKQQRILFRWQKQFTLQSDDNAQLDKNYSGQSQVKRRFNPLQQISEIERLQNALNSITLQRKLKDLDIKLMQGVIDNRHSQKKSSNCEDDHLTKKEAKKKKLPEIVSIGMRKQKAQNKLDKSQNETDRGFLKSKQEKRLSKRRLKDQQKIQGIQQSSSS